MTSFRILRQQSKLAKLYHSKLSKAKAFRKFVSNLRKNKIHDSFKMRYFTNLRKTVFSLIVYKY